MNLIEILQIAELAFKNRTAGEFAHKIVSIIENVLTNRYGWTEDNIREWKERMEQPHWKGHGKITSA